MLIKCSDKLLVLVESGLPSAPRPTMKAWFVWRGGDTEKEGAGKERWREKCQRADPRRCRTHEEGWRCVCGGGGGGGVCVCV